MIYLILLLAVISLTVLLAIVVGRYLSGPGHRGPITDHFNGVRFVNVGGPRAKGLWFVLKWMTGRRRGPWKRSWVIHRRTIVQRVDEGTGVTLINHSTFLIQMAKCNLLVDPVWSDRASPFQWAGPRRMRPPGLLLEEIPPVDIILISHNHYDHLDLTTLKMLFERDHPEIVVPLGVKHLLAASGIQTAAELDWWQPHVLHKELEVISVPAQHFSGRGMFDRDRTLWCGYVLRAGPRSVYYAGDTGYNPFIFREIGERLGPFCPAIIPIGAYKPRWFMAPIHCDPGDAVRIHIEVRSQSSIACHFGTFPLADDGQDEPVHDLAEGLVYHQIPPSDFVILENGETRWFA